MVRKAHENVAKVPKLERKELSGCSREGLLDLRGSDGRSALNILSLKLSTGIGSQKTPLCCHSHWLTTAIG